MYSTFFFFNDTATTEIYTLSLHDALPIYHAAADQLHRWNAEAFLKALRCLRVKIARHVAADVEPVPDRGEDRKSTRLNSSHDQISYAVFCLKKKKNTDTRLRRTATEHSAS